MLHKAHSWGKIAATNNNNNAGTNANKDTLIFSLRFEGGNVFSVPFFRGFVWRHLFFGFAAIVYFGWWWWKGDHSRMRNGGTAELRRRPYCEQRHRFSQALNRSTYGECWWHRGLRLCAAMRLENRCIQQIVIPLSLTIFLLASSNRNCRHVPPPINHN